MDNFVDILKRHFIRFHDLDKDNLPHLLTPPRRDMGRQSIAAVLNEMGARSAVEIGVRGGGSAAIWLDANPEMHLSCIDPWRGRQAKYKPVAEETLRGRNVTLIQSTSMDAAGRFADKSLDFVHIDGNHEFDYVVSDIVFWSRKLKLGGVMALHDYLEFYRSGVLEAVRAYTYCHKINPWFVTRDRLPTAFWQAK